MPSFMVPTTVPVSGVAGGEDELVIAGSAVNAEWVVEVSTSSRLSMPVKGVLGRPPPK